MAGSAHVNAKERYKKEGQVRRAKKKRIQAENKEIKTTENENRNLGILYNFFFFYNGGCRKEGHFPFVRFSHSMEIELILKGGRTMEENNGKFYLHARMKTGGERERERERERELSSRRRDKISSRFFP